jgi:histone chaperone ASF1
MSVVSLLGVKNLNNPAAFTASYQFEITFECLEQLQKGESWRGLSYFSRITNIFPDLEWKLTYVGSATSYVDASRRLH